ncbi:MAG: hypothetical protein A2Z25_13535 [Planctomycetes bacterium RBG_16_55_9]|nr:MAG: hypothetical protein A2Z25_13535 [Planctomycetes bacterium RBG_16_55_9]
MTAPVNPKCPVCKARFRGQRQCSRCGADLSQLMRVVAGASQLRRQARQALCEARYSSAYELAAEAQNLHDTALGRKMMLIAQVLDMVSVRR